MRKEGDYDWLLSKLPGWKTYSSVRASWWAFQAFIKKVRAVLAGIPPYIRSNKRYIAKYSLLYIFIWALEWLLGVPVEFTIFGGGVSCLITELYIRLLRPLKPTSVLSALRKRAFLKKKAFRRQKPAFIVWSTFYVGVGRFLSNPTLRVTRAKAAGLFNYIWLAAFVETFLDFLLCPLLMAWLTFVPPSYSDHARFMELMVSGFFIDNGLDYTQSHLINWLISLVVFIFLICQTTLIEGQNPSPLIRASLKRLLVTLAIVLCLEVLKVSALDFVLINQLNVHPLHATGTYVFLPFLWWLVYLRTFEYLSKRNTKASTVVFNDLADLNPELGFCRNTALLRLFVSRVPLAVALGVFCFFYLAVKTFSLLVLGLD